MSDECSATRATTSVEKAKFAAVNPARMKRWAVHGLCCLSHDRCYPWRAGAQ